MKSKKNEALLQKRKLIQTEDFAAQKRKIISIYKSILQQKPIFYHLNSQKEAPKKMKT